MNIFLQIALGLVPATILFLLLTILQKKHRARNIAMLSVFVIFLAGTLIGTIAYKPSEKVTINSKSAASGLDLIYAVANNDSESQLAEDLLKVIRGSAVSSSEIIECDTLLRAKEGDYYAVKALINKAEQLYDIDFAEELKKLCDACFKASKDDNAASDYLGNKTNDNHDKAIENLKKFADKKLKEKTDKLDESVQDTAKVLSESEGIFSDYLYNDNLDTEAVSKLTERISEVVEENPDLLSVPQVRSCRLKLLVLDDDYEKIANIIDDNSSYEELAVASELYINKLVKKSDFDDEFADSSLKMYETVAAQVEDVIEDIPKRKATELRRAEELLDSLKDASEAPALYKIRDEIANFAEDEEFGDRPKAYLQLARVEHSLGKSNRAHEFITNSLDSIGFCEDDNFTVPMANIVDSITDKDDPEKLKNVAQYVEDVTSNTADVVVSKAVKAAKEQQQSEKEYNEEGDETENGTKTDDNFDSFMTDYVSLKRVSFNITNIDASKFETVRATVSVDDSVSITAEELKNMISLEDCGVEITDFEVEKVEYKGANILLCCDVSGSMSGKPIEDLRNAVALFADTATDIESLALVTFEGGVTGVWDFGTPNSTISSAASSLNSGGGTNMYDAIIESIGKFNYRDGELNFILLLSDGDDGVKHSAEDIMSYIGEPARDKGIVLYSLGLGNSVNTDYMNTLASSTGGSFLYVEDSTSLSTFYDNLRSQIVNQYIITFKAEDTLSVDRELSITLKEDSLTKDTDYYNLRKDGDYTEYAPSELIGLEEKGVYGLDSRFIFRSAKPVSVKLSGFGFKADDSFSITLDGDLDYGSNSVTVAYENANTLSVLIPGGIACGTYDVRVNVNGKVAILNNELTVAAQGEEKTTEFGPYIFTSYQKSVSGDTVTLSGNVTLNGWLTFDGEVSLKGDLKGQSITMTDNDGSYVKYYTDTADGLAAFLAKRNSSLSLPAFGELTLYNDSLKDPESDDYPVQAKDTSILSLGGLLSLNSAGMELYPNRFEIRSDAFSTKFPLQESLLKAGQLDKLFNFEVAVDGVITNQTIGVRVDVDNTGDDEVYNPVNMGSMPIYITPASYKIHIDTVANEYSVEYSTKVAFINSDGLGFQVEWKERESDTGFDKLCPSKVMLMSDIPIKATLGTIPVTYGDFKLGAEDIDPNASIFDWMLVGSFDLQSVKVSDYIKGLEKYIQDPAIVKLDDTTLKFSFGQAYISIETKLQLFEQIDLAKAKIEAGRIPFSNIMLGINNEEALGVRAALTVGIIWKTNNCDIDLSGTTEFSAHSRFTGVEAIGKCNLKVNWWVFEASSIAEGRAIIGFYVDNSNRLNFIVKARGNKANTDRGKEYYIYWNDDSGLKFEKKKF